MRTVNFTEARSKLRKVLDAVTADHTITIITRRDDDVAVIMSLSDYNSMQETLYLFGTRADAERLHAAMAEADDTLPAGARILEPKTRRIASAVGSGAARKDDIKAATRARLLKQKMKGNGKGWWSRRISLEHRLVYRLFDRDKPSKGQIKPEMITVIQIAQSRYHYDR